ncbi:MAG: hypothetical protein ACYTGR_03390 [Planctomycetota bacterium]|jgi:hypothetical protein
MPHLARLVFLAGIPSIIGCYLIVGSVASNGRDRFNALLGFLVTWAGLAAAYLLLGKIGRVIRASHRLEAGLCVACGHDLRGGAADGCCPECGTRVSGTDQLQNDHADVTVHGDEAPRRAHESSHENR